jgi:hypothetical protein
MTLPTRLLISLICLGSAEATWGQAPLEPREQFVCTSGFISRVVSIASVDARERGGCRVDYTKDGKTKTLWSSHSNHAYCIKKALSLVTKLIQGNYSCRPESLGVPK